MKIIYDNSYENKSRDSMWKSRVTKHVSLSTDQYSEMYWNILL